MYVRVFSLHNFIVHVSGMCLVIPITSCQQQQQYMTLLETEKKNKEMNSSRNDNGTGTR